MVSTWDSVWVDQVRKLLLMMLKMMMTLNLGQHLGGPGRNRCKGLIIMRRKIMVMMMTSTKLWRIMMIRS